MYSYTFNASACASCQGRCCTGESGYIFVSKKEIYAIAELLNLDVKEFVDEFLYKKGYKYSIKETKFGDQHSCIFYDKEINGCKIYEARPSQCITFPFWDYYKTRINELKEECPGVVTP